LFTSIDDNHDGQINKAEMKAFIERVRATKVQDIQEAVVHEIKQTELIDEIWAAYDKDNSGQLSASEMRTFVIAYLTKVGEANRLPEKQFNGLFNSIDINHDGQINKAEMKAFIDKVRATKVQDIQEAVAHEV
jgi:Ca2+-binding EF-hand superfamily protein